MDSRAVRCSVLTHTNGRRTVALVGPKQQSEQTQSWREILGRDDPENESLVKHVLTLVIGIPLVVLLLVGVPLAIGIVVPMTILMDHTGLSNLAVGAISIPCGIAVFVLLYYAVAKGWVTIGDD
jgi:hypothetical protein